MKALKKLTTSALAILASASALLCSGCSTVEWSEGTSLDRDQFLTERFSKAPETFDSLLPEDAYTEDEVNKLAESNKAEYDKLIQNFQEFGRYDGLEMVVWKGAEYHTSSKGKTWCLINYGINQAGVPNSFEIYDKDNSEPITTSLDSYIVDSLCDGESLYVLCSDGSLLCVGSDNSVKEKTGVFDPAVYSDKVSLTGNSSVLTVLDVSKNTIMSESIEELF